MLICSEILERSCLKIAEFLCRHPDNDPDSPNEIIPNSFVMKDILHGNKSIDCIMSMINMDNHECDEYIVITRRMTKIAQAKIPPIHVVLKSLSIQNNQLLI